MSNPKQHDLALLRVPCLSSPKLPKPKRALPSARFAVLNCTDTWLSADELDETPHYPNQAYV